MSEFLHSFKLNFSIISDKVDASDVDVEAIKKELLVAIEEASADGTLMELIEGPFSGDVLRSHHDGDQPTEIKLGLMIISGADNNPTFYQFETNEERMNELMRIMYLVQGANDGIPREYHLGMVSSAGLIVGASNLVAEWNGHGWMNLDEDIESAWDMYHDIDIVKVDSNLKFRN